MRKLLIVILSITFVYALPTKDNSFENNKSKIESSKSQRSDLLQLANEDKSEDGWFVPQQDGSLKWETEEEAQLKMRALAMSKAKAQPTKVEFYLYSNYFPIWPEKINAGNLSALKKTMFNSNIETVIIIHGWQNNYKSDVNTQIREAYFSVGEFNMISVDWSDRADRWNYHNSVMAIPDVGQQVADLIDFLRDEADMRTEDLKVIGHSLGAHVAGYAGKLVQGEKIKTIIGLDTAFPLFSYNNCEERLCTTDADYVESIHTNGNLLGFIQPIGHTAFYPNGGKTQPGCGIDATGTCSHSRAYTYYAEAISDEFLGLKCDDWRKAVEKDCPSDGVLRFARFDSKMDHSSGTFYSPVNKKAPYGLQF